MLTGLYPARHGLKDHETRLHASIPTLAEVFGRGGFVTAAVVNTSKLGPKFGLPRGFSHFQYLVEQADRREPMSEITDLALSWLERFARQPLFLFVHYYDIHSDYRSLGRFERMFVRPYEGRANGKTGQLMRVRKGRLSLEPRDVEHLVDLYDAGIRQMDAELERLLRAIEASPQADRAVVVVTSDHGEEFLERGGVLHGRTQYQELLRVPLIVRVPGLAHGHRIATPVSLVDVFPTLLAQGGIAPPPGLDGEDLASLWSSAPREHLHRRVLFAEADHFNSQNDIFRAVRRENHKLHYNRLTQVSQLYDLRHDPGEREDLLRSRPEVAADLGQRLSRFLALKAPVGEHVDLSPEELEHLRSLGYLQ
jgi:arylsulfatase A-like enzyme